MPLAMHWTQLFNTCLSEGKIPAIWKKSDMFLLFKGKGPKSDLNNYRGISLESCPFKVLTKLLKERLETHLDQQLAPSQYGFRKQRSTRDPLSEIISGAKTELNNRGKLYAAFVDFQKAFDSVDRSLLLSKLRSRFSVGGAIFTLIANILTDNTVNATDGLTRSGPIKQNIGVIQGDSLSPYLFILFIDDVSEVLAAPNTKIYLYADDLAITAPSAPSLQSALDLLSIWCNHNALQVNIGKTKVMKFRRGGRLARADVFNFMGQPLDLVNEFCYLGVTLQTTLSFTKHIKKIKTKALASLSSIRNLQSVSVETGLKLFNIKVFPVITYCLREIAPFISAPNLQDLDIVFSAFLKRLLGLPRNASATLCHELLETPFLAEHLLNDLDLGADAVEQYILNITERRGSFEEQDYRAGPAFQTTAWRRCMQKNRHWIMSFTAHGFHHLICTSTAFHAPCPDCCCMICGAENIGRYHVFTCPNLPPDLPLQTFHSYIVRLTQPPATDLQ